MHYEGGIKSMKKILLLFLIILTTMLISLGCQSNAKQNEQLIKDNDSKIKTLNNEISKLNAKKQKLKANLEIQQLPQSEKELKHYTSPEAFKDAISKLTKKQRKSLQQLKPLISNIKDNKSDKDVLSKLKSIDQDINSSSNEFNKSINKPLLNSSHQTMEKDLIEINNTFKKGIKKLYEGYKEKDEKLIKEGFILLESLEKQITHFYE